MSLSFPASPSVGQTSTQNGRVYTWSGYTWQLTGNVAATSHSHAASDITSGTLSQARLDFVPIHPFLLMGG